MPSRSTTVAAPGRLHFGMFAVGEHVENCYGGIGLMIDEPRTEIRARPASKLLIRGKESSTCRAAAESWFQNIVSREQGSPDAVPIAQSARFFERLPVELTILCSAPRHFGLGSGTQLALTTAMALNEFFNCPTPSPAELAVAVGRAQRSAVGSYGFFNGGFLVDRGKSADDSIGRLDFHVDFPDDWPIVLIFPDLPAGLAGDQEAAAFARLPATMAAERDAMVELVHSTIVPAVVSADYETFAEGLFEFGYRSGRYFESVQGGVYNGRAVADLVEQVRRLGVPATGQTSWGPCVFAVARDEAAAEKLVDGLNGIPGANLRIHLTRANNRGAAINGRANLSGTTSVLNKLQ